MLGTTSLMLQLLTCLASFARQAQAGNLDDAPMVGHSRQSRVVTQFRTEMLRIISSFPVSRQCDILTEILERSGEGMTPVVGDLIYKPHQHLPCLRNPSHPGRPVNTPALVRETNTEASKIFNQLPTAFQCKIMSDVTRAMSSQISSTLQVTKQSLQNTMTTLRVQLRLLDINDKCADVKFRALTTKTQVRLTIRLRKPTSDLDTWLKLFNSTVRSLYLSQVLKSAGKRTDKIINGRRSQDRGGTPTLSRDKLIVRLQDVVTDNRHVIVTFSLLARQESGNYTVIDGEAVAAAFKHVRRSQLNNLLQAEIIGWSVFAADRLEHGKRMRNRKRELSQAEMARMRTVFPKYLLKLFKSMSGAGRCYILHQLSIYLGEELLVVEKSYHHLGFLPKKYFCSRSFRQGANPKTLKDSRPSIWDRVDELCRTMVPVSRVSSPVHPTATHTSNATIVRETKPFNSMELVMFALLGFLCLLILVFVANCVVFTFKTKKLTIKYETPSTTTNNTSTTTKQHSDPSDKSSAFPRNEEKLDISENPLHYYHADQRHYHSMHDVTLPMYDDNEPFEHVCQDQTSRGVSRKTRMWSNTTDTALSTCDVTSLSEGEDNSP